MSYTPDQLIRFADKYATLAARALKKVAEDSQKVDIEQPETFDEDYQKWLEMNRKPKKLTEKEIDPDLVGLIDLDAADDEIKTAAKKEKKKLDPKAKVRNRGTVCVPAESAKDKKDHFPINDEGQARNALARVHQYSSAPAWYSGSLKGLQDLVSRKVHSKYPSIGKADKKSKKSSEYYDELLTRFAQVRQPISFQRGEGQIEFPDEAGNFNLPTSAPKVSLPVRPEVMEAQKYLINLDPNFASKLNAAGGADGKFGPVTQAVVKEHTGNNNANQALQLCIRQARAAQSSAIS